MRVAVWPCARGRVTMCACLCVRVRVAACPCARGRVHIAVFSCVSVCCVHMSVCMRLSAYVSVHTCLHTSVSVCTCLCVCVHVSVCMCLRVRVSVCLCVHVPVTNDCLSAPNPLLIPGAVPARRGRRAGIRAGSVEVAGPAGGCPQRARGIPAPRPPAAGGPSIFFPGVQCCAAPVEGAGGTRQEEGAPLAGA